jgi:hypothetical protein
MKFLFYLLLLSPLWAAVATRLAVQVAVSSTAFVIFLIGLLRGIVSRKNNIMGLVMMIIQIGISVAIFWLSKWFFKSLLSVGDTTGQRIVFWIVAILICFAYLPEVIQKTRRNWNFAHIPGAVENYTLDWKVGLIK